MRRASVLVAGLLVIGVGAAAWFAVGRDKGSPYPAPRFPAYLQKPQSVEALVPPARLAVRNPGGRGRLGQVNPGDRVLVVVPDSQDLMTFEAIKRAWGERNIQADAISSHVVRGLTEAEFQEEQREQAPYKVTGGEGWKEIGVFRREIARYLPPDVQKAVVPPPLRGMPLEGGLAQYLDTHPEYTAVFVGGGGGPGRYQRAAPHHAARIKGNWLYTAYDSLASKVPEFPGDLNKLAEEKVLESMPHVSEVRITDPEGTDFTFSVRPDEARQWREAAYIAGHLFMYPVVRGPQYSFGEDNPSARQFAGGKGVIAGCSNHTAYFPCAKVRIENGMIQSIEGGGKFGDLIRDLLENPRLKNAHYPSAPYPGYWYLWETAMGTSPKFFRPIAPLYEGGSSLVNAFERNQAGVIHWGIGYSALTKADVEYARQNDVPPDHSWHIHTYFSTYQAQLRDTGEWITLSDRGQLRAFEDPEVQALAARYGDPALILRYEWVPAIPGINAPGNYERDYALDPWAFIKREIEEIQKGSYRYLIPGYPTPKGLESAAVAP